MSGSEMGEEVLRAARRHPDEPRCTERGDEILQMAIARGLDPGRPQGLLRPRPGIDHPRRPVHPEERAHELGTAIGDVVLLDVELGQRRLAPAALSRQRERDVGSAVIAMVELPDELRVIRNPIPRQLRDGLAHRWGVPARRQAM